MEKPWSVSGRKELLTPPAIKIFMHPIVHECEYAHPRDSEGKKEKN